MVFAKTLVILVYLDVMVTNQYCLRSLNILLMFMDHYN